MSITDELRKFAWKECPSKFLERVIGIADDIDKKHESVCCEIADKFDGWVIPPKDADGEAIHIGDEVDVINYEPGTVASVQFNERGWLVAVRPHGWDTPTVYHPESIRHVKPDSWERIIEDAMERGCMDFGSQQSRDALVERCKRLAGEDV